jgi:membrane protein
MPPRVAVARIRDDAARRWRQAQDRHYWLRHLISAWTRFQENRGGQLAAAITYFSFLSLIPLILLGVSIAGFVLAGNPDQLRRLLDNVATTFPGAVGHTLQDSINFVINHRTSVGVVGLAGMLFIGLGWIGNLRTASNTVWGIQPVKGKLVRSKFADLVVLVGLGISVLISIGLTAGGTALAGRALDAVHIDFAGAHALTTAVGLALALAGDLVIFAWLLARLPRVAVPRAVLLRGALLAAIGFEVLKIVGTWYIAVVNRSPTAGVFGSVVGVLVWLYLVARYFLFCAAWTATGVPPPRPVPRVAVPSAPLPVKTAAPAMVSVSVAASLVGTGMAIGAAAVAWLTARRRHG